MKFLKVMLSSFSIMLTAVLDVVGIPLILLDSIICIVTLGFYRPSTYLIWTFFYLDVLTFCNLKFKLGNIK